MPQFDVSTYPSLMFWLVISFSLLYIGLKVFVLPNLSKTLDARVSMLQSYLDKAETYQKKTEDLHHQTKKKIQTARDEAHITLQETMLTLSQTLKEQETLLFKKIQKEEERAESKIDLQVQKIREELMTHIPEEVEEILKKLAYQNISQTEIKSHLNAVEEEVA